MKAPDMTAITLEQASALAAGDLARHSAQTLYRLKLDAEEVLLAARDRVAHIERALTFKYADAAQQLRLAQGKDTGVVHLTDGDVRVTADLPKRIDWDQAKLRGIVARIQAQGEDPSEFVEIKYSVREDKFTAWPESLKAVFTPARTLKTGKPGYRLALVGEGGDA